MLGGADDRCLSSVSGLFAMADDKRRSSAPQGPMKILAFGPHPDDIEFGCAPILMQEADRGHEVSILVATRGEAASSGTPEQREREARAAAKIIGASIDFLNLGGDCHIQCSAAANMLVARQIR